MGIVARLRIVWLVAMALAAVVWTFVSYFQRCDDLIRLGVLRNDEECIAQQRELAYVYLALGAWVAGWIVFEIVQFVTRWVWRGRHY